MAVLTNSSHFGDFMTSKNIYYVYLYKDPDTLIPFYVGMGKMGRYLHHLQVARKNPTPENKKHNRNKIRKLLVDGKEPVIDFYMTDVSRDVATTIEKALIKKYGRRDLETGVLTNQTDGGDGTGQRLYVHSEETRKKISESRKQGFADGTIKPTVFEFTEEILEKMRQAKIGNKNESLREKAKHKFQNKHTKEIFIGSKIELSEKYNLQRTNLNKLFSGVAKSIGGWTLLERNIND